MDIREELIRIYRLSSKPVYSDVILLLLHTLSFGTANQFSLAGIPAASVRKAVRTLVHDRMITSNRGITIPGSGYKNQTIYFLTDPGEKRALSLIGAKPRIYSRELKILSGCSQRIHTVEMLNLMYALLPLYHTGCIFGVERIPDIPDGNPQFRPDGIYTFPSVEVYEELDTGSQERGVIVGKLSAYEAYFSSMPVKFLAQRILVFDITSLGKGFHTKEEQSGYVCRRSKMITSLVCGNKQIEDLCLHGLRIQILQSGGEDRARYGFLEKLPEIGYDIGKPTTYCFEDGSEVIAPITWYLEGLPYVVEYCSYDISSRLRAEKLSTLKVVRLLLVVEDITDLTDLKLSSMATIRAVSYQPLTQQRLLFYIYEEGQFKEERK